jgi:hypothetical protein
MIPITTASGAPGARLIHGRILTWPLAHSVRLELPPLSSHFPLSVDMLRRRFNEVPAAGNGNLTAGHLL